MVADIGTVFYDIHKLPHVTRVGVSRQDLDGLRAEALDFLLKLVIELIKKILHQQSRVALSFPQGRHLDPHHVESKEKILSEASLPHHVQQISVGCGDQPDVSLDAPRSPQRNDFSVVKEG